MTRHAYAAEDLNEPKEDFLPFNPDDFILCAACEEHAIKETASKDGDDWLCAHCAKPFGKCQDCRHIYPEEELLGGLCRDCR